MGLKHAVRRQVVDCVVEGRVKRFSRLEMLALVKARTGETITMRSLDNYIRASKEKAPARLQELKESRYAFLDEVFQSKDNIERLIQESWLLFHKNENNPHVQLSCIHEMHQLEITRSNIVDVLPAYGGMKPTNGKSDSRQEAVQPNMVTAEQRARAQAVF